VKTQKKNSSELLSEARQRDLFCSHLLRVGVAVTKEAPSAAQAIQFCLRGICEGTQWAAGHAHMLSPREASASNVPVDLWHVSPTRLSASLLDAVHKNSLRSEEEWHSRMVLTGRPIIVRELQAESGFSGKQIARKLGLKSAIGMPVMVDKQPTAICEFFSPDYIAEDDLWLETLASVGVALGLVIERKRSDEIREQMTGKFLELRDDERRRLARELHDSTAQNILAIIMDTDSLGKEAGALSASSRARLLECGSLARQCLQEIRTFSYLLHPPILDECGLISSLRVFVEGFAERSGIAVGLDLPEYLAPMRRDLEIALFRVVQESLSNVHKHSGSTSAYVRVWSEGDRLKAAVADKGKGIPRATNGGTFTAKVGVGIASMQERVKSCGGHLNITSLPNGTKVEVSLPVAYSSAIRTAAASA
jgi:signal transduction histidine kinase